MERGMNEQVGPRLLASLPMAHTVSQLQPVRGHDLGRSWVRRLQRRGQHHQQHLTQGNPSPVHHIAPGGMNRSQDSVLPRPPISLTQTWTVGRYCRQ